MFYEMKPAMPNKKKRILYIHHGGVAGATISLLLLAQHVNKQKYDCFICSNQTDPLSTAVTFFSRCGFQTYLADMPKFTHTTGGSYNLKRFSGWLELCAWLRSYKVGKKNLEVLLREIRPDVVHFNSLTLAPYTIVPFKLGIPNILHVRESVLEGFWGFRKAWLCYHLRRFADKVIFICRDNLDRINIDQNKTIVIYNPVDFGEFDYTLDQFEARRLLNIPMNAKVVLLPGGSSPMVKGIRHFLEAMANLTKKEPNLICMMPFFQFPPDPAARQWTIKRRIGKLVGIYKKSDDLFALTRHNDLFRHIVYATFTHEIKRWIAAADVVCVLHTEPHFSRTVMEAGAMKKPVVAFRIGGVEEVVKDGETGLLVPLGDVQGLTEATEHLLDNPALRQQLGENGYAQAVELFDANKHAQNVERIYESLVDRR
jgi:glycosyltransferase involved in cell wall biosynthesis